jgi:hypothetical protein
MRRRDRASFRDVAGLLGIIIIVRAGNPFAGRYIGQQGFRPWLVFLPGVAHLIGPHAGLIAADPGDPLFAGFLASLNPPRTPEEYHQLLKELGLTVGSSEQGWVVRDEFGAAFYPTYCLHGVYDIRTRLSAWTAQDGELIRAELNRRLGADLVQFGPYDTSDYRPRGRDRAPQPPVLFFLPDGNVEVRFDAESMESYYRFLKLPWASLYPSNEPAASASSQ